jgi:hypothetical protein
VPCSVDATHPEYRFAGEIEKRRRRKNKQTRGIERAGKKKTIHLVDESLQQTESPIVQRLYGCFKETKTIHIAMNRKRIQQEERKKT